ncbi:MAG TPA: pitrilysin family protein [Candidatus Limnocylindrales bacterium]|nr:pitrilysin family protein [Candidatus Limnocylindrales bacterium]
MNQHLTPISNGKAEIPSVPAGVKTSTLDNGLTVIVREDHSAPVVSAQAWCMAGSIHEGKWLGAGMSHVLEHMLFKGTTTRPGSRIDQEVQEAGGYMNAYTSFDRTVYHIDVPNTGARVAIDILCDIMQNASLPADEMEKEKQVIIREMDMNVDDPNRRASRRLFETAYVKSPYRFTIIGYPDIFHELRPEDIRAYYQEKYAPNNVFFVVAGDVKSEEIVDQIRTAYAKAKTRPMPPVLLPEEPRQLAAREVIEEAPIELAYFHLAWHIPQLSHPDVPVLDVLAALLGNGRSSRLYRQVREAKALVHAVDAWTYNPGAPGLFGVSVTSDSAKFTAARDAILHEIEAMKTSLVPADELGKAIKQFIAGTLSTRKTMQGQAQDLGANWLTANDLNFSERYLAAVKTVTPAELQRVAQRYLTAENRTLYGLLPSGSTPKVATTTESLIEHPIRKYDLPNGLRVLLKEDHRLPFVEFRAVFMGGVLVESPDDNGITQLMSKLLLKGTQSRSAEDIAREIESVGGSIDTYGGNNSFGVNVEVMNEDFGKGLSLLADVLLNPTFPSGALDREREVQLASIRAQRDQLLQSASKAMRRTLFGNKAYGLDPLGNETSVPQLTVDDLKNFHSSRVTPNNGVLAIFGDIDEKKALAAVERAFHAWQAGPTPSPKAEADKLSSIKRVTELRDKKQAVLVIGYRGTTLHEPDRYALELLQEACSDLGSRLFLRIREKLGLAYYVGAQNFTGLIPGFFTFYVGTMPEKAELVEKELLAEAELLRQDGLTEEELNRAKAKVIGQKKISRQDLGTLAMTVALDELYGLGYEHSAKEDARYEAVSVEELKTVARKYLRPDAFVVAVVRPQ